MKKTILLSTAMFAYFILQTAYSFSQGTAINSSGTAADNSAMLDVSSAGKGMLIPRVSLLSVSDQSTIVSPATYLMVFNTNPAITNGNGVGMYYFNGAEWVYMAASSNGPGANGQVLTSGGGGAGVSWTTPANGTVNSVSGTAPVTVTGTTDPVVSLTSPLPVQNGGTAKDSTPGNGEILIGNGTDYTLRTITAGSGITVSNGSGTITISNSGGSGSGSIQTFNSTGTWTKPGTGGVVHVQCWGGGGSGGKSGSTSSSYGGGGGGGYSEIWLPLSSLGATETVTIGLGGASKTTNGAGNDGENSSFGSWLTAYGGGGANRNGLGPNPGYGGYTSGGGGSPFGGDGGNYNNTGRSIFGGAGSGAAGYGDAASSVYGGGGGGYYQAGASAYRPGGSSFYGGGGGSAGYSSVAGTAGTQPGGGGGASATGASGKGGDGRCVIVTW